MFKSFLLIKVNWFKNPVAFIDKISIIEHAGGIRCKIDSLHYFLKQSFN